MSSRPCALVRLRTKKPKYALYDGLISASCGDHATRNTPYSHVHRLHGVWPCEWPPRQAVPLTESVVRYCFRAGTIQIGEKPIDLKTDYTAAHAVLGMQRFRTCSAVAIVTAAQEVAVLNSDPIYKVTGTAVLSANGKPPKDKHDARYLSYRSYCCLRHHVHVVPCEHCFGICLIEAEQRNDRQLEVFQTIIFCHCATCCVPRACCVVCKSERLVHPQCTEYW